MLAKESIFYKTHSKHSLPVEFFFLTLKGDDLCDEIQEFLEELGENLRAREGVGCLSTSQRFAYEPYKSSTLTHK